MNNLRKSLFGASGDKKTEKTADTKLPASLFMPPVQNVESKIDNIPTSTEVMFTIQQGAGRQFLHTNLCITNCTKLTSKYVCLEYKSKKLFMVPKVVPRVETVNSVYFHSEMCDYVGCKRDEMIKVTNYNEEIKEIKKVVMNFEVVGQTKEPIILNKEKAIDLIKKCHGTTVLNIDQKLSVKYDVYMCKVSVLEIDDDKTYGVLGEETEIELIGDVREDKVLNINSTSFTNLDVGGVDKQFHELFQRVFLSRVISKRVYEKLGITHTKGVLLYGPPGTGKTRIARSIKNILNCKTCTEVSGPSIVNKFVGQSEENIRKLFEPAIRDPDSLHALILDEFDAIAKPRGSGSQTGVTDSIVNQLLSCIDGVHALNNIIIFAMTNRKDMIDEALLRPGRFSVHIEIGLPDFVGRTQIFTIHTKRLYENKLLDETVDFKQLAKLTENYTGAEIEEVVKVAASNALGELVDFNNIKETAKKADNVILDQENFMMALESVKPMFGNSSDIIDKLLFNKNLSAIRHKDIFAKLSKQILDFKQSDSTGIQSILLHGCSGSGKTFLSALLAKNSKFKFVKYVYANDLITFSDYEKAMRLQKILVDGMKSKETFIVFDDLDIIADWTPHTFSNKIVQTIKAILGTPVTDSKLVIIINCTNYKHLHKLGMFERIKYTFSLGESGSSVEDTDYLDQDII